MVGNAKRSQYLVGSANGSQTDHGFRRDRAATQSLDTPSERDDLALFVGQCA